MPETLPSIKKLETIAPGKGQELRSVLEAKSWADLDVVAIEHGIEFEKYSSTTSFDHLQLVIANKILGTHGVEYIRAGRGSKSPAIQYCNSGDGYTSTLMHVAGKGFRVGRWADIVEKGRYA